MEGGSLLCLIIIHNWLVGIGFCNNMAIWGNNCLPRYLLVFYNSGTIERAALEWRRVSSLVCCSFPGFPLWQRIPACLFTLPPHRVGLEVEKVHLFRASQVLDQLIVFFLELSRLSLTSGKEYLPVYCHCHSTEPLHWSIL